MAILCPDTAFEQSNRPVGHDFHSTQTGRQQNHLTLRDRLAAHGAATLDAYHDAALPGGADCQWGVTVRVVQSEVFAIDEIVPIADTLRCDRVSRPFGEVGAGQPVLDVELSRLAGLRIDAVPVIEPVRDVAGLLHFK